MKTPALLRAEAGEEGLGERQDVLAPLAERGEMDRQDVEAVEEVGAEAAGIDLGLRGRGWSPRRCGH